MWKLVANEMKIPWRSAEGMHWIMGETEMARRANVTPFSNTIQPSSVSNMATTLYSNGNHNGVGHQRTASYRNANNTIIFNPEQLAALNAPLGTDMSDGPVSTFTFGGSDLKKESISSEGSQITPATRYTGQSEICHPDHHHAGNVGEELHPIFQHSSRMVKDISENTCQVVREKRSLLPSVSDMECMVPISAATPPSNLDTRQGTDSENGSVSGRSTDGSMNGTAKIKQGERPDDLRGRKQYDRENAKEQGNM